MTIENVLRVILCLCTARLIVFAGSSGTTLLSKGLQSIVGSSFMGAEGSCRHSLIRHRGGVRRGGLAGSSFLSLLLSGFSLLAGLHCRIGLTFSGSNRLVLEASTGSLWGCRLQALWSLR